MVINHTIKSIAGSRDLPRCCHCCSTRGYTVAKVVAVCAAPCIRFGRFNAFLLLFQKEQSQGTPATTVTRGIMSLLVEVPSFMDGNTHYFIVVEDNN